MSFLVISLSVKIDGLFFVRHTDVLVKFGSLDDYTKLTKISFDQETFLADLSSCIENKLGLTKGDMQNCTLHVVDGVAETCVNESFIDAHFDPKTFALKCFRHVDPKAFPSFKVSCISPTVTESGMKRHIATVEFASYGAFILVSKKRAILLTRLSRHFNKDVVYVEFAYAAVDSKPDVVIQWADIEEAK